MSLCYVIPIVLLRAPHPRLAGQEALRRAEGERRQPEVLHGVGGDAHGGPVGRELVPLLPHVEKESGEAEDDEGGLQSAPALPAINHSKPLYSNAFEDLGLKTSKFYEWHSNWWSLRASHCYCAISFKGGED